MLDSDGEPLAGAEVAMWTRNDLCEGLRSLTRRRTRSPDLAALSGSPRCLSALTDLSATHRDEQGRWSCSFFSNDKGQVPRETEAETSDSGSLTFSALLRSP